MTSQFLAITTLVLLGTTNAMPQDVPVHSESVPLYRVTVIDRTVNAVDYQYRNGPTMIDFRGTVLLPEAKGEATVESKAGRVEIDVRFDRLAAPTRYGREYLTYVLWAITPDGHAKNLGEILPGSSEKAHLRVTTDFQAFGMIVTAEPYSAVRLPSDVVVLENQVRPDTIGAREPIRAKYELLPRGHYVYNIPGGTAPPDGDGPRLSMDQYHEVLEIYQAQNAVQIARAAGAGQYAPDSLNKAEALLVQAQQAQASKVGMSTVVTFARQSVETAEDARILTIQRKEHDDLANARDQAARAEAQRSQAEAAAQTAQTQAAAAQALLEQERAARREAEAAAAAAAAPPPPPPPPQPMAEMRPPVARDSQQKTEVRMRLFQELTGVLPVLDTPRGLVITVPDADFRETSVAPGVMDRLARLPSMVGAYPSLSVRVEGYGRYSGERAFAIMDVLAHSGMPMNALSARGLGDERPLASNATAAGREQNRRVEIVISGAAIGQMPYWSRTYSLAPTR